MCCGYLGEYTYLQEIHIIVFMGDETLYKKLVQISQEKKGAIFTALVCLNLFQSVKNDCWVLVENHQESINCCICYVSNANDRVNIFSRFRQFRRTVGLG